MYDIKNKLTLVDIYDRNSGMILEDLVHWMCTLLCSFIFREYKQVYNSLNQIIVIFCSYED